MGRNGTWGTWERESLAINRASRHAKGEHEWGTAKGITELFKECISLPLTSVRGGVDTKLGDNGAER